MKQTRAAFSGRRCAARRRGPSGSFFVAGNGAAPGRPSRATDQPAPPAAQTAGAGPASDSPLAWLAPSFPVGGGCAEAAVRFRSSHQTYGRPKGMANSLRCGIDPDHWRLLGSCVNRLHLVLPTAEHYAVKREANAPSKVK